MIAYAHIVSIIGSGLLATQTTAYLGDTSKAGWLSTMLTIFTLALNPIVSQAADYWGRKSFIIVFSLVGGFAGPMIISRANSMTTLISGFCVLGLAFGSQALTFTVASEVIPRRYRAVGQATLTASSALGGISATLAGSALIAHSGNYRTFWYIVAGLYLFGALGVAVGYNPPPRLLERSLRQRQKFACLDWMGTALLTAGLTLFCIALQWSGNPYPWSDPHILAPFILAVTLLLLFIAYERRFKNDGILHHGLFQHRNLLIALVAMFIEGVSFFSYNSYYALEVDTLTDSTMFSAGLQFTIIFFSATVASVLVAIYTSWARQFRETLLFGFACFVTFNALMASVTAHSHPAVFWTYPTIGGAGLGTLVTNLAVVTQMSTPSELISITTGILIATRSLGGTVGLAVNHAILSNTLGARLGPAVASAVLPLGFPASEVGALISALEAGGDLSGLAAEVILTPQMVKSAVAARKGAYVVAFRNVWISAAAFSFAGLCCELPRVSLSLSLESRLLVFSSVNSAFRQSANSTPSFLHSGLFSKEHES
jgi:hypothetical protein